MNHFAHLYKQVKTALIAETKLSPDERRVHQWQFLTTVNNVMYLVGKGGANTMFYSINGGEVAYLHPDKMLDTIKSWSSEKYNNYVIVDPDSHKVVKTSTDLDKLKSKLPKKFKKFRLFGMCKDGSTKPLYELRKTLSAFKWVSLE